MRVLFVSTPVLSHLYPMVPLAWSLRSAGHDVLVATSSVTDAVRTAGLTVEDVTPGFNSAEWEHRLLQQFPEIQDLPALDAHGLRFAALNDLIAKGLSDVVDRWRPDVVVYSEVTTIAAIAAAERGIPAVRHAIELCDTFGMLNRLMDLLVSVFGHAELPVARTPRYAVTISPPSFGPRTVRGWPMRCVPFNGGFVVPDWLREPPGRTRIVVTEGTSTPGDECGRLRRILSAAPEIDAEFVLAVGRAVAARYEPLPSNVHVPDWVPLTVLLRGAAALIHHGGAGTTTNALHAGVPQLILPDDVPRRLNAEGARNAGGALVGDPEKVDAALIRQLITDPALAEGSAAARAELYAMPSPHRIVERIEELAGG